jgi:hypothetical protein
MRADRPKWPYLYSRSHVRFVRDARNGLRMRIMIRQWMLQGTAGHSRVQDLYHLQRLHRRRLFGTSSLVSGARRHSSTLIKNIWFAKSITPF